MTARLTERQRRALGSLAVLSPLLRLVPRTNLAAAGDAGWLAPLAALPLTALYALVLRRVPQPRSRWRSGLCAAWFLFYGAFLLRMSAERFFSALTIFDHWLPFAVVLAALAALAAAGGEKPLCRAAECLLPAVTAALLLAALCAVPQMHFARLKVVSAADVPGILRGALPIANVGCALLFALHVFAPERSGRSELRWAGRLTVTALALSAAAVGVLGSGVVTHLTHPFFVLLRNLSLSRAMERIEALVTAVWVLPDFAATALLLLLARREGAAAFGRSRGLPAPVCAVILLAAARAISPTAFGLEIWSERIVPAVSAAVLLAVPALDAAVFALRRRRGKLDCQSREDTI